MPKVFMCGLLLSAVLLLMPSYALPKAFNFYDKLQHGMMFAPLSVAGLLAYPLHRKTVVWGLLVYGGVMEVLQSTLTATRHGDWWDWLADAVGVAVGLAVFLGLHVYAKRAIRSS